MKKLFSILAICALTLSASAQSTVKWPYGKADFQTPTVTTKVTAQTFTVTNNFTYVDLGTIDTNKVMTATIGKANIYGTTVKPDKGAILVVHAICDGTARTIASSTGLSCSTVTLTASKEQTITYVYNGTALIGISTVKATQ